MNATGLAAYSSLSLYSLEKDVSKRPRYDGLLKHQFIQTSEADYDTDVKTWYQSVLEQAKQLTSANKQ